MMPTDHAMRKGTETRENFCQCLGPLHDVFGGIRRDLVRRSTILPSTGRRDVSLILLTQFLHVGFRLADKLVPRFVTAANDHVVRQS
jgi:hypothetical protein